jgi:hypothetical protein
MGTPAYPYQQKENQMTEVKYRDHPTAGNTPEQRIAARLRNSGSPEADVTVQKGDGPTRSFTNIHTAGNAGRRDDGKRVGPINGPLDRG